MTRFPVPTRQATAQAWLQIFAALAFVCALWGMTSARATQPPGADGVSEAPMATKPMSALLGLAKASSECLVTVDADKVATVECGTTVVDLSVLKAGTGGCTVRSSVEGIDCGGTCSGKFPLSSTVRLTVTPDADSLFLGWSGACTGTGTCDVTLDQAKSVTATCNNVPVHTLTVLKSGTGDGSVVSAPEGIDCGGTCSKAFIQGTQVTLSAAPNSTSVFVGWGGACSGTGTCTVTANEAKAVIANFSDLSSQLTIVKFGTGECAVQSAPAGVDCGGTCAGRFLTGTRVRLVAIPGALSNFAGWGGSCTGTGACDVTVDADKAVTATCTASPAFVLTVIPAGSGGGAVVSDPAGLDCGGACSSAFPAGATVTLRATPNAVSTFLGWGGPCTGTGTCTVIMNEAKAVTATFVDASQSLSVLKAGTGDGVISSAPAGIECGGTCAGKFLSGSVVRLVATPGPDSVFDGWRGACTGADACFVTLDAAKSVTGVFTDVTSTLSVATSGAGGGTVNSTPAGLSCTGTCSAKFITGSVVRLSATPDPDSLFAGWQGPCSGTGTCTVTLTGALLVTAVFVPVSNSLTVLKSGTGTCAVTSSPAGIDCGGTCSASYPTGTQVRLRVTPEAGSTFVRWGGACDSANSTFTISAVASPLAGGSVVCTPNPVPQGGNATCTATASPGYVFNGFSGACTGLTCTLSNVTSGKSVTANFVVSAAVASATPTSLAFGNQAVGSTSPAQIVTLSNAGGGFLTINSLTSNSAQFVATQSCGALASGASCPISVAFTPTALVSRSGTLLISTNGGDVAISVSGAGVASASFAANVNAVVAGYYETILNRAPDAAGLAYWSGEASRTVALGADVREAFYVMAMQFFSSTEYVRRNTANDQYIRDLYQTFFGRQPDSAGLGYWLVELASVNSRSALLNSFLFSPEYANALTALFGSQSVRPEVNLTMDFFRGAAGRLPDNGGFVFWRDQLRAAQCQGRSAVNAKVTEIGNSFFGGAEYALRSRNLRDFVGDLYNTYLRRGPGGDSAGFNYWVSQAAASRDAARNQFVPSVEFQARVSAIVAAGCALP